MGKKGKNTAKKKAARNEIKAAEKADRELKRCLPVTLDALLAKAQEETKDIDLFADPPPQENCPICLHPDSLVGVCGDASSMVHSCCGKKICRGCMHASMERTDKINQRKKKNKEPLLPYTCAFCREPKPSSFEEDFERYLKRAEINDGKAFLALAEMYREGVGVPKDEAKALDLYCRAAELGVARAYCDIAIFYDEGIVVEKSGNTATAFDKLAAKKGCIQSRHNLGVHENNKGNYIVAIRHYKISAEAGWQPSLDRLKDYLKINCGLIESGEFADILGKCLASQAEMKTDQRDAWMCKEREHLCQTQHWSL